MRTRESIPCFSFIIFFACLSPFSSRAFFRQGESQNVLCFVGDELGLVLFQLADRPESPSHAASIHATVRSRLHIHVGIPDIQDILRLDICPGNDFLNNRRVGLRRHTFALSEDCHEADIGEEMRNQLLRPRLIFVRGDSQRDAFSCKATNNSGMPG